MLNRSIAAAVMIGWPIAVLGGPLTLEVGAGKLDRIAGTPLICDLPVGLKEPGSALLLVDSKDGGDQEPIPAQIIPGGRTRVVWILRKPLKAGESRRYQLDLRSSPEIEEKEKTPTTLMNCLEIGSSIEILDGSDPVLRYNKEPTPAAAEKRSGLFTYRLYSSVVRSLRQSHHRRLRRRSSASTRALFCLDQHDLRGTGHQFSGTRKTGRPGFLTS